MSSSSSWRKSSRRFYRADSTTDFSKFWDYGEHFSNQNRWCFEVAWECANKVGGIYTVIRSKTGASVNEMGDQYVCVGPYFEAKARAEIEEEDFPPHHPLGQAVGRMRERGYRVATGRWLVEGNPQILLFDIGSGSFKMNEFKNDLFEKAGIGIPHEDIEANDVAIFGSVCLPGIKSSLMTLL